MDVSFRGGSFADAAIGISVQKRGSAPLKVAYRGVCFRAKKMVGIERFVKNNSKEKKIENFLQRKYNLETLLCCYPNRRFS